MREARRVWLAIVAAGLFSFHPQPAHAIDAFVNLGDAVATLTTGYDASATTVVVAAGRGALLPAASFNCTWWNDTDYPGNPASDPTVEIIRVTAKSTDTLTITRAQEGTSAATHNAVGKVYKFDCTLTAKTLAEINTALSSSAGLRGTLSDEVGTGPAYFVGGALGTPASGTATNLTGTAAGLTAGAATALAANGANCSAGQYPLGVDASGAVESCTTAGAGDASTNTSSSVDSEVALFSSTTGKLLKRATGSGFGLFTSGVLSFFTPASGIQTFLTTPSSANLAAAITDEASGTLLYFTGGALGTPSSGVATNLTGTAASLTAGLATALAGNGANCSAGSFPLGVDASGAVESCTAAATIASTNTFTGRQDANGAASTAPNKSGTSVPGTCTVGDVFFETDATAGQNLWYCTATNTYTQQLNSGSSGAPSNATYLTQTANGTLSAEQALSALSTGLMKVTTTTGAVTSIVPGTGIEAFLAAPLGNVPETDLSTGTTIAAYNGTYKSTCGSPCTHVLPTVTSHNEDTLVICVQNGSAVMTLDANGSQTIDGALNRIMVPGECANLEIRNGEWTKVSGRSIALSGRYVLSAPAAETADNWALITLDSLASGSALLYDATNDRVTIPRPGTWAVSANVSVDNPASIYFIGLMKNGSIDFSIGSFPSAASVERRNLLLAAYPYVAGDYISPAVYLTSTGADVDGEIQIHEVGPW